MMAAGVVILLTDSMPKFAGEAMDGLPAGELAAVRRFAAVERDFRNLPSLRRRPRYLTLWDLRNIDSWTGQDSISTLVNPGQGENQGQALDASPSASFGAYRCIHPVQQEYRVPESAFVMAVGHDPPPEKDEEFNAWYSSEHLPSIVRVPGFATARRFVATKSGGSPKYIALYDLHSYSSIDDDSFLKVRDTPWSAWVRTWFNRRWAYLGQRIAGTSPAA